MRLSALFLKFAAVASVLFLSSPVSAAEPLVVKMEGYWGGLPGAHIVFTLDRTSSSYRGSFDVRAAGLVNWITALKADAHSTGAIGASGAQPSRYIQHVGSKKSERVLELSFEGNPAVGVRVRDQEISANKALSANDPEAVDQLPETMRRGVIDPIAALLNIGSRVVAGDQKFTLPVFDGRRRIDLEVTRVGPGRHSVNGRDYDTIDANVVVHALAGFQPFHLRWWNNAKLEVFIDPTTGLPVKISSSSFLAAVVLGVTALCPPRPADACKPEDS